MLSKLKTIIISRTDGIGDVILTLPICGIIKKYYPDTKILFLGRTYTEPIINCCEHVDGFINADELSVEQLKKYNADAIIHVFPNKRIARLSKQAGINLRIGTTNRIFHWTTVNKLVRLSRKNSSLHESQLNFKLLEPLGINIIPDLKEISSYIGFTKFHSIDKYLKSLKEKGKLNIILRPKTNNSGREWSMENYKALINLLPSDKYKIFITGSKAEQDLLSDWIMTLPENITDLSGKLSLPEFISFIKEADYLVATSTGPLHIAAACGIGAIGIYPPIKPINPTRWQPIGKNAKYLCVNKICSVCRSNPPRCHCINEITPQQVAGLIL
jgi:heptosyltransferase-3